MQKKAMKNEPSFVKRYLSDVHAQNIIGVPIFAISESLNGFTVPESIHVREMAYISGLLGVGYVYAKGNDLFRRGTSKMGFTTKFHQSVTDTLYSGLFSYGYSTGLYTITTQMSVNDMQTAVLSSTAIGLSIGGIIGYCTNVWRDCFNIHNPDGKPTFARDASLRKRMSTIALSTALAFGVTVAAYEVNKRCHQQDLRLEEKIAQNR